MDKVIIKLGEDSNRRVVVLSSTVGSEYLLYQALGRVPPKSDAQDYLMAVGKELSLNLCGISWEVWLTLRGKDHKLGYQCGEA
jgi:hypothetical protein